VTIGTGLIGATVLHYHVLSKLGQGGMGEVYLAEDQRLGRRVALKFLASHVDSDPEARDRLVREAQAAALLRSPHIAVTYDLAEYEGGLFIAMEYVEGELLSSRISASPLAVPESLDIELQLADALDEAHQRGIVHRDIKSTNVMITDRHLVKVLDFGLAKFVGAPRASDVRTLANATASGLVLGTLNYMAPEQLTGGAVDGRSDLFSAGVVLYEMLTGRLPFVGNTLGEIADRILHHEPDAIARYNYAVPEDVEMIVRKVLQKRPEFRYQTARDFYIDLLTARRRASTDAGRRSSWLTPVDFADAALPMAALASPSERVAGEAVVAVLNFANITGNAADDWIGQGIAETLTADLTRIKSMAVVARERIFELQRNLNSVGRDVDERQAIEIGRLLGASVTVSGAYQRLGDRIRITCQVIDVATGRHSATVKVDGRLDDLFELQDRLVTELAAGLAVEVPQQDRAQIELVGTESIDAFQAFSRGMLNLRMAGRESMERGITLLEQAIELDPNYVEAMVELAGALELKALFLSAPALFERSLALTDRALAVRPDDAAARVQRGDTLLAMGRVDEAIADLHAGIRLQPDRATAHGSLARAYWLGKGQVDEAIREFEETLRLNPQGGYTHLQLSLLYSLRGQYDAAERIARQAVQLQDQIMSGSTGLIIVGAHSRLGYALYRKGQYDDAIREYRRELDLLTVSDHLLRERTTIEIQQKLGAAYRRKGEIGVAEEHEAYAIRAFSGHLATGADEPYTRYYMASLYALRGDAATAREHLELPLNKLAAFTRWRVVRDPDFEPVKDHALFRELY
jgi:TolB-like protein/tRNA A-37 threonylcarbamoyl transferase component Bud32/Flp pilus assembly protein TadD